MKKSLYRTCMLALAITTAANGGEGVHNGPSNRTSVRELTFDSQGNLLVGGGFRFAGGDFQDPKAIETSSIARYDGDAWSSVPGSGLLFRGQAGIVESLLILGDDHFVAGGQFDTDQTGQQLSRNVAEHRDGVWRSMGVGVEDPFEDVLDLVELNGSIYAGGQFNVMDGIEVNGFTRWDGQNWNVINDPRSGRIGVSTGVAALTIDEGLIYIGGNFRYFLSELSQDDTVVEDLVRFDETAFSRAPSGGQTQCFTGSDRVVAHLSSASNGILIGGNFTRIANPSNAPCDSVEARGVALMTGSGFVSRFGNNGDAGPDQVVTAMAFDPDSGLTYVAGQFFNVNGIKASRIYATTGTDYIPLVDEDTGIEGLNGQVRALVIAPNGDVYVGGEFSTAGGKTASNIARWDSKRWHALEHNPGPCTFDESLKAKCKPRNKSQLVRVKLKNGLPTSELTFRLDGNAATDVIKTVKNSGKAKAKFKKVTPGDHSVRILECDLTTSTRCR